MGVKPDRWIREQAKKGMIEPFEESQVSNGVISYGVSSYGYDMRITDEFKIFTNIYSTLVDPKNFSEKSFVDFKGKECIIPPNSFALAKSLEYFRIPRDILCIVLGKSTYARMGIIVNVTPLEACYGPDTEILTLNGWKNITEIKDEEKVATLNTKSELEYQQITAKQKIPFRGDLISVKGRNLDLLVTPEHFLYVKSRYRKNFEFLKVKDIYGKYNFEMKRDAIWKGEEPKFFELLAVEDDSYKRLNITAERIFEMFKNSKELSTKEIYNKLIESGDEIAYENLDYLLSLLASKSSLSVEKRRIGKTTNKFYNLNKKIALGEFTKKQIPIEDWVWFIGFWLAEGSAYSQLKKGNYEIKIAQFRKKNKEIIKEHLSRLPFNFREISTGFEATNKQLSLYLQQFGHSKEKYIPDSIKKLSPRLSGIFLDAYILGDGNKETNVITTASKRMADDLQEVILKSGHASIIRYIKSNRFHFLEGRKIFDGNTYKIRVSKRQLTPKIYNKSFSKVPYNGFVYDVTVPNHTLYVRRNGKACWSSNCWEGFVTIEISNTTPLPVKIYANEGIAQVVFLSTDKECEVSYKDRKGKYQNQTGIWLPKIK